MEFGLALSGGGLRGAAHIGVLKALAEEKLTPSWISGTSAGSIVAGLYSCGFSPTEIENFALSMDRKVYDLNISGLLKCVLQLVCGRPCTFSGIIKGNKFEKLMKDLTKGRVMRDCNIPTAITGVDINNGKTIYFLSDKKSFTNNQYNMYQENIPIYSAIRASISIPVVFKPAVIDGFALVDGGVTDGLPGQILKQMGAKRVIGVDLGYAGQLVEDVNNIAAIANQSLDIMEYKLKSFTNNDLDLIINPQIYDVGLTDFDKIPECIERGYNVAMYNMPEIKRVVTAPVLYRSNQKAPVINIRNDATKAVY